MFIGAISPIDPYMETEALVRARLLEAEDYVPVSQCGTNDDCGVFYFCEDTSTSRDRALEKIRVRVAGISLAADVHGGSDAR